MTITKWTPEEIETARGRAYLAEMVDTDIFTSALDALEAARAELAAVRSYFAVSDDNVWAKIVAWNQAMPRPSPDVVRLEAELAACKAELAERA